MSSPRALVECGNSSVPCALTHIPRRDFSQLGGNGLNSAGRIKSTNSGPKHAARPGKSNSWKRRRQLLHKETCTMSGKS